MHKTDFQVYNSRLNKNYTLRLIGENLLTSLTSEKMRKIVSYMHASFDGFVAGLNGEMDWINIENEIFEDANQRTEEADTALYGRVTYQMMEDYWPTAADKPNATKHDLEHSKWYKKVFKVVLSKSMQGQNLPDTKIISDNISNNILELKQQPGKNIIIFGSPSASHTLMELDLIDEIWVNINPILLGKGIPLFKDIKGIKKMNLLSAKSFKSGVICAHYELKR